MNCFLIFSNICYEKRVMHNLIHFKLKMLIVLMICIFMSFYMLIYVMNVTEKCENSSDDMCFRVSQTPIFRATYLLYNQYNNTEMSLQILKPKFELFNEAELKKSTTEMGDVKIKRTTREIMGNAGSYNRAVRSNRRSSMKSSKRISQEKGNNETYSPEPEIIVNNDVVINSHGDNLKLKFQSEKWNSSGYVYIERQKRLRLVCPKHLNLNQVLKIKKINLNHILIDEKHKLLYCYVPKVACTNWKRIFMILTGKTNNVSEAINLPASEVHAKNLFKSLQNYSNGEIESITEGYRKFIFVRHPFERLLSAYRNKLEQHYDSSKYFQARFGKFIIKNFRKNPTNLSLEKGDDVTFAEFANYLVSRKPDSYNEHWQRVTDLCHPCLFKYDFIGKYESFMEDSNFLMKVLGLNFTFPELPKPSTTAINLKKYYNTLNKTTFIKLYKIFEMDFRLFGYDLFNVTDWYTSQ